MEKQEPSLPTSYDLEERLLGSLAALLCLCFFLWKRDLKWRWAIHTGDPQGSTAVVDRGAGGGALWRELSAQGNQRINASASLRIDDPARRLRMV